MRILTSFAALPLAALTLAYCGPSPAGAAPLAPHLKAEPNGSMVSNVHYRHRGVRWYLPIAPSYSAYDYPYYYARGYYPRHIGPGYIYYGYPYAYYGNPYAGYAQPYRYRSVSRRSYRGRY